MKLHDFVIEGDIISLPHERGRTLPVPAGALPSNVYSVD